MARALIPRRLRNQFPLKRETKAYSNGSKHAGLYTARLRNKNGEGPPRIYLEAKRNFGKVPLPRHKKTYESIKVRNIKTESIDLDEILLNKVVDSEKQDTSCFNYHEFINSCPSISKSAYLCNRLKREPIKKVLQLKQYKRSKRVEFVNRQVFIEITKLIGGYAILNRGIKHLVGLPARYINRLISDGAVAFATAALSHSELGMKRIISSYSNLLHRVSYTSCNEYEVKWTLIDKLRLTCVKLFGTFNYIEMFRYLNSGGKLPGSTLAEILKSPLSEVARASTGDGKRGLR